MAVYYKFKSAKDFNSIAIDGHFISVFNFKEQIFESRQLGRGTDFDLVITHAQTNEEYNDEAMLIPKNTSVLVRRVPGCRRMPIVVEREREKVVENDEVAQPAKRNFPVVNSSVAKNSEETEWDGSGNDFYDTPRALPAQSEFPSQEATFINKADEDSKIKAFVDAPSFDWQQQSQGSFGAGRGFGRGMGGRAMGGRGFGQGGMERRTPPEGYICYRCKVPGHFIQHCPTNGDHSYDVKRVNPPTGIPKSMLMPTADGSYALSSGSVGVLQPNEAAFDKEFEGLNCTKPLIDIPPELRCPLCKEIMQNAVLTSKCCFQSFCDKCIRDTIISKSMCICGATNILADYLIPNKTVRDTINSILEPNNSSAGYTRSILTTQDTESARSLLHKVPSPSLSASSKNEKILSPRNDVNTTNAKETLAEGNRVSMPLQSVEKTQSAETVNVTDNKVEVINIKGQNSAPQKEAEAQGKKKKKKTRVPVNAGDHWGAPQDIAAVNYMMPFAPPTFNNNPYWGGMQLGMNCHMGPYNCAMPYMGYAPGPSPFDIPIGGMYPQGLHQGPFGGQGYSMPSAPLRRDLSVSGMGLKPNPSFLSREESEARKADLRKKHENEMRDERAYINNQEFNREATNRAEVSSTKSRLVQRQSMQDEKMVDRRPRHHNDGSERSSSRPQRRSKVIPDHDESSEDDDRNFKRKRSSKEINQYHEREYEHRDYERKMSKEHGHRYR
ncbi:hypothetical protein MKW98_003541 [Papaver atlanticum]|uniref:DWNN domain-containing protein n=1 Tax=Papaver atlanticum TaxID=357466 RepID=A0AAD4XUV5_9MAGN|nr:hypothetical protein MKW98_003541 [Papaver atlanticum]